MGTGHLVLIVDDDEDLRDTVAEALHGRGFAVLTAASGRDALRVVENIVPSVILLDVAMPDMDGRSFLELRAVRADLVGIPVVLTSGRNPPEDIGPHAFIQKPYSLEALIAAIEEHLATSRSS